MVLLLASSAVTTLILILIFFIKKTNQLKLYGKKLASELDDEKKKKLEMIEELERYRKQHTENDYKKEEIIELYYNFELFNQSYPIIKKLSKSITDETEKTSIKLANDLQILTRDSIKAGNEINKSLSNIYNEEQGKLNIDLEKVVQIVNGIQSVAIDFSSMTLKLEEHMKKIDETVKDVFESMYSISDLSEQTHLLSINAAVVASRIGNNGSGFNIIASEVQKLAGKSKNIAQDSSSMLNLLMNELDYIHEYFSNSIVKMDNANETLNESKSNLQEILEEIKKQVSEVEYSVTRSRGLSDHITKQLGKLTYSLQFQDITQQQINNMMRILNELRRRMETGFQLKTNNKGINVEEISEKAKEIASTTFTVQNEWNSIDKTNDEQEITIENKKETISDDLEGDITIF